MKELKNLTDLQLYKQKLKYKELLLEKELIGSTAGVIDHFTDKVKDYAFDLGTHLVSILFKHRKRNKSPDE